MKEEFRKEKEGEGEKEREGRPASRLARSRDFGEDEIRVAKTNPSTDPHTPYAFQKPIASPSHRPRLRPFRHLTKLSAQPCHL